MSAEKGIIFNIQHFSIHDGPGIRTTVFLKGCPLRCPWCANPESQKFKPEPMLDASSKKTITMGEEKSVEEIIKEVLKDREFYEESGGGLTEKFLLSLNLPKQSLKLPKKKVSIQQLKRQPL